MNAARKRRLELKKRIETQRKQRDARDLEQAKKPFKDPGTYKCKHKVSLFDHCKICWEELGRRPDVGGSSAGGVQTRPSQTRIRVPENANYLWAEDRKRLVVHTPSDTADSGHAQERFLGHGPGVFDLVCA